MSGRTAFAPPTATSDSGARIVARSIRSFSTSRLVAPGKGDAEWADDCEHKEQRELQEPDREQRQARHKPCARQPPIRAARLEARGQHYAGDDGRRAAQRGTRDLLDRRDRDHASDHQDEHERRHKQARQGDRDSAKSVESIAYEDRDVDDVAAGQHLTQAEQTDELTLVKPTAALDEGAMGPGEDAAEARQRHLQERPEQLPQRRANFAYIRRRRWRPQVSVTSTEDRCTRPPDTLAVPVPISAPAWSRTRGRTWLCWIAWPTPETAIGRLSMTVSPGLCALTVPRLT